MTIDSDAGSNLERTAVAPLLEMQGIVKEFPGVRAVRDVSLNVMAGEVLAVVGENGAGKSTLMRVAAGVYTTHSHDGVLRLAGEVLTLHSVADAEKAGIFLVSQEVQVVPEMTVAENIFLNREVGFPLRMGDMEVRSAELLSQFGLAIDPRTPIRRLGVGQRQMVMLARARERRARLVIFDEPTASLSGPEVRAFYGMVSRLTATGVGCVFVSHRIDEVFEIADRIAVMRNGELVTILDRRRTTPRQVVSFMLGREVGMLYQRHRAELGPVVLELSHMQVASPRDASNFLVSDVSFTVRAGEIVGVFGLLGAGRTELAMALVGAWPGKVSGQIAVMGNRAAIHSPGDATGHGMALLTEDRRRFGLFPNMNIIDNVNLGSLGAVSKWQVVNDRLARNRVVDLNERFRIKAPSWSALALNLSGGNQQKVLLARLMAMQPGVLILDEPTRGIDVGAKSEIFALLDDLTKRGLGVLLISSELNEVALMSDRIVVMYKGRVTATFDSRPFDEGHLLEAATGGKSDGASEGRQDGHE